MNGQCDRCGKRLSTGDFNQLCRACDDWLEKNYPSKVLEAATIITLSPAAGYWRTDEPPRDGREFLVTTCVEPFMCYFVFWNDEIGMWDMGNDVWSDAVFFDSFIAYALINPYEATP